MSTAAIPSGFLPVGIQVEPRRLDFSYGESRTRYWVDGDAFVTRFVEALSMLFPDGERFVVEAVQHYRARITDPVLSEQIAGFVRQEGLHSSEHRRYNARSAGGNASKHQRVARVLLYGFAKRFGKPIDCLAITVAIEHFTAILADELLKNPHYVDHMAPEHARLWLWHAVEETEHKAVAFDVYRAVGGGYLRRAGAMFGASGGLVGATAVVVVRLLAEDGELWRWRNLGSIASWGFLTPGVIRRVFMPWLGFFRPSFHPWQHDNSELVTCWKESQASTAAVPSPSAS